MNLRHKLAAIVLVSMMLSLAVGAQQQRPAGPECAAIEPELFAPGVISTGDFELGITFSSDGREAVFAKISPNFATSVLVVSRLRNGAWSEPELLPFASAYRDLDPSLSADGKKLFFQSDRPVTGTAAKDWDIWVAERQPGGAWGEPRSLGAPVNTPATETFPVAMPDGSLYFASERPGGRGGVDVYRARPAAGGGYGEPENLGAPVNTEGADSNFAISPDGTLLVLTSSNRPGHRGDGDLYFSGLRDGAWSEPEHLCGISTAGREFAPSFSPDGNYLYFTSNRPRPAANQPAATSQPHGSGPGSPPALPWPPRNYAELLQVLHAPGNGLNDIYRVEVRALGVR